MEVNSCWKSAHSPEFSSSLLSFPSTSGIPILSQWEEVKKISVILGGQKYQGLYGLRLLRAAPSFCIFPSYLDHHAALFVAT